MMDTIYQDIVENIREGVRVLDEADTVVFVNPALCKLYGIPREEIVGRPVYDLYPEENKAKIQKSLAQLRSGKSITYETNGRTRAGLNIQVEVSSVPIMKADGTYRGNYTVVRDISEKRKYQNELITEKNFLNELISLCPDSIMGVDRKGYITIFNRAAERLSGYSREEAIGNIHITKIYHPPEIAKEIMELLRSPEYGGVGTLEGYETQGITKFGRIYPVRLSAIMLYKYGKEVGSVGFFHDLSLRKEMEARLKELSITDSLSKLFNQRYFHTVLADELSRSVRYNRMLSLICFDIDNFKDVNDVYGHLEGDNVIRMVGQILIEAMRKSDKAFRYGGDEFMVILPETGIGEALLSAEKIRNEFNVRKDLPGFCKKNNTKAEMTLSIGVAQANPEESPENLIKRADLAMYEAKRSGGNRTVKARATIADDNAC